MDPADQEELSLVLSVLRDYHHKLTAFIGGVYLVFLAETVTLRNTDDLHVIGLRRADKDDVSTLIGFLRETGCVCAEIHRYAFDGVTVLVCDK